MNSLSLHSSISPSLTWKFQQFPLKRPLGICSLYGGFRRNARILSRSFEVYPTLHAYQSISCTSTPSEEGVVSVIDFDDLAEKDFSFLDSENLNSGEEYDRKINRIFSAGEIAESCHVMVSIPSEGFVDRLFDSVPCQSLLIVHDSIIPLACIKEKYDKVKCWQGEVIYVPEKWAPFDVVFLYYLPAIAFDLNLIFEALGKQCRPGARVVISHPHGRKVFEQERQQFPDVVVSDLPDKMTLQKVAADQSIELTEFVDEQGFYLAVLKFQ